VFARVARGTALAAGFTGAARRYWLGVFPRVCREVEHWRRQAAEIPDPVLRRLALENLRSERLNLDGAAAFAAFVPGGRRSAVVRAQVAFQAAYDYVDTLAEQPSDDPVRNGDRLHRALRAALDPGAPRIDYYEHHRYREDGGYLVNLIERCRRALHELPSYAAVAAPAIGAAARIVSYQSLNLAESRGGHGALERWARARTPPGSDLRWWETAASAGSSLGVFVLIAAAAERAVRAQDASAIAAAYFPWIGSLHTLLDSLIDRHEDAVAGQCSLLDYYSSPEEAAARMALLAGESLRRARALPRGGEHALVLAGMTSHYLSMPAASLPDALPAARSVLAAMGGLAVPTMLVMGARHMASSSAAHTTGIGDNQGRFI
jgi:tetraprenyl-beta-curcumene synthase